MGKGKWIRREAGSVTGTIVPPPVPAAWAVPRPQPPPLPKRHRPDRPHDQHAEDLASATPETPPPLLPDNVRALFKPVLTTPTSDDRAQGQGTNADPSPTEFAGGAAGPVTARPELRAMHSPMESRQRRFRWPRRPENGARHAAHAGRLVNSKVALTVVVALATIGTTLALVQVRASEKNPGTADPGASAPVSRALASMANAAAVRARTASWIAREVSRSAIVACDAVMCSDLYGAGLPSSNLLVLTPTSRDPLGADVIVATPVVRSLFGTRLAAQYAPGVMARFGHGPDHIDVRQVAADGAGAYVVAVSRDLTARRLVGAQLAGNRRIRMPAGAEALLSAGRVDPRLLILLPALAAQHPIRIFDFYDMAPRASRYVPLTGVVLAGTDGLAGLTAGAYRKWLLSFLLRQIAPFKAASVTTSLKNGRTVISVRFSRPNPFGLLH